MATGVVPGVLVVSSADQLPLPPPPGVVVVASRDAEGTARELLGLLGVRRYLRPVEARTELQRRRDADLAEPQARAQRCRAEAAAARATADTAREALPPGVATLDPIVVRRAGAAVREAVESVEAARSALGPRPRLDAAAARSARQAEADLELARAERYSGLPQANSILTMANVGAALLVAGRLLTEAVDPAFFLVALVPLAAIGFTVHTLVSGARRCRSAARRRWTALRSLDLSTMAGLTALEARAEAWEQRSARLAAAEVTSKDSENAWRSLSGSATPVAEADDLAARIEAVASLEALCREAAAAWVESAVELQEAEDVAGSGHPPILVLDAGTSARPETRRRTTQELARLAGTAPVVVVARSAAGSRPASESPAPGEGAVVVDLRERVLAGLNRLRSRSTRASGRPPGSVAAGG